MTAAIIITGEIRSLDKCLPNLWWFCFRHFQDAHVFVSTVKDQNSHKAGLLRKHFKNVTIEEVEKQPDFPDLKPWTPGTFYSHEPYAISVSPTAVLRQLWQLEQGWNLYIKSGLNADVFIRCRPDIWFHNFELPPTPLTGECFVPDFGTFGGVNDRFAIMGLWAAQEYFRTFWKSEMIVANGCPIHPESLIKASLEVGGASIFPSPFLFSTVRTDGTMRPPEITQIDLLRR